MTVWNEATPAGTDFVSGGDDQFRDLKAALGERLVREHRMARAGDDATDGTHQFPTTARAGLGAAYDGSLDIVTEKSLRLGTGAGVSFELPFASGTKAMFNQAAAPDGWTKDVDVDDKAIILTSGVGGGGVGGSWTISGVSVDTHAITVAEMPTHQHGLTHNSTTVGLTGFVTSTCIPVATDTGFGTQVETTYIASAGSGNAHGHTMTIGAAWRPAYQYVIKCTKN